MRRAEELAGRVERAYGAFADYLEGLRPEQWRARAVNSPEIAMGEDEDRPVGVVAHHVATAIPPIAEIVRRLAGGEELPPLTFVDVDAHNVGHAAANPDPDQAATIGLIRQAGAGAADVVRGLSDEHLEREGDTYAGRMSADRFVRRVVVGHVLWHEGSIRATFGEGARDATEN
jgi:hypothetical protein